jgi:hypothetical protein
MNLCNLICLDNLQFRFKIYFRSGQLSCLEKNLDLFEVKPR